MLLATIGGLGHDRMGPRVRRGLRSGRANDGRPGAAIATGARSKASDGGVPGVDVVCRHRERRHGRRSRSGRRGAWCRAAGRSRPVGGNSEGCPSIRSRAVASNTSSCDPAVVNSVPSGYRHGVLAATDERVQRGAGSCDASARVQTRVVHLDAVGVAHEQSTTGDRRGHVVDPVSDVRGVEEGRAHRYGFRGHSSRRAPASKTVTRRRLIFDVAGLDVDLAVGHGQLRHLGGSCCGTEIRRSRWPRSWVGTPGVQFRSPSASRA